MFPSWKLGELLGVIWEKAATDRTNDDTKYRKLVEKLIQLEANDWPKFQEPLKNYSQLNFT